MNNCEELSIIQTIGRQITTKAASVNLNDLLEEIRRQIGTLMDVSNFSVFLLMNRRRNSTSIYSMKRGSAVRASPAPWGTVLKKIR